MEEPKSPAEVATENGATSSGVEALIERLRQQGVEAGRLAREEIVGEADREAERVVKKLGRDLGPMPLRQKELQRRIKSVLGED
jgi:V/A-type H+-transporting ATPase subunit E